MLKKYSSIIIFALLLLVLVGGAYASDNNTDDLTATDDDVIAIESDDNMELSSDNDDADLKASDDEKLSNGFDEVDYETSGNWTELRQVLENTSVDTYDLDKDYYYQTVHLNSYTVGSRVITFNQRTFTIDGHGHTLDFRDNFENNPAGGRINLYD